MWLRVIPANVRNRGIKKTQTVRKDGVPFSSLRVTRTISSIPVICVDASAQYFNEVAPLPQDDPVGKPGQATLAPVKFHAAINSRMFTNASMGHLLTRGRMYSQ